MARDCEMEGVGEALQGPWESPVCCMLMDGVCRASHSALCALFPRRLHKDVFSTNGEDYESPRRFEHRAGRCELPSRKRGRGGVKVW